MPIKLYSHQLDALERIHNGCILCGGVGSGKSITSLAYYYLTFGGSIKSLQGGRYLKMREPKNLYIITTARKRDTLEWEGELAPFLLSPLPEVSAYENKVVIDSWNNIKKYADVRDAFFIFDEQKVIGNGAWVKSFLKIAKANQWILLSATPGDTWTDYIPVFIANGFYKSRSEFINRHVVFSRAVKFPKIDRYLDTGRLIRLKEKVLVKMNFERPTVSHDIDICCPYDTRKYKEATRTRWNPYKNEPMMNAAELCYIWRRITNESPDRVKAVVEIAHKKKKVIIFYNFDYELELLRAADWGEEYEVAELNGHMHQDVPLGERWIYLVQYNAGAEAWNCIRTDTIIFYSRNYSYKIMVQSAGRIDRMNTPYTDLYYYHLRSTAPIDVAIGRCLSVKKNFNEGRYINRLGM